MFSNHPYLWRAVQTLSIPDSTAFVSIAQQVIWRLRYTPI